MHILSKHYAFHARLFTCFIPAHRSSEKLTAVKQELDKHAKKGVSIHTYTSDFSSFEDIRKLADKVKADHQSIDVLINNAGIFSAQRELSTDGIELTWAVNALAPFLLTSLLLDRVKERIVNVGSMALAYSIDLNNLEQVRTNLHQKCTHPHRSTLHMVRKGRHNECTVFGTAEPALRLQLSR